MSEEENLDADQLQEVIDTYLFAGKKPLRDDIIGLLNGKPKLKERATIAKSVANKILGFVETFISGITG